MTESVEDDKNYDYSDVAVKKEKSGLPPPEEIVIGPGYELLDKEEDEAEAAGCSCVEGYDAERKKPRSNVALDLMRTPNLNKGPFQPVPRYITIGPQKKANLNNKRRNEMAEKENCVIKHIGELKVATMFKTIDEIKENLTVQTKALQSMKEESINQTTQIDSIISNLDEVISMCNRINSLLEKEEK